MQPPCPPFPHQCNEPFYQKVFSVQLTSPLQVRVVRIFNTYGPRMALDDGRVVSNFVTQALTGLPLTIYGDGQQTRSFQYISDLVKGQPLPPVLLAYLIRTFVCCED